MRKLLIGGVLAASLCAYAQTICVPAPPAATIRLDEVRLIFRTVTLPDGGVLTDGGCVGFAYGSSTLAPDHQPRPNMYEPANPSGDNLCVVGRAFGRGAILTDLGRGDGGPP